MAFAVDWDREDEQNPVSVRVQKRLPGLKNGRAHWISCVAQLRLTRV